MLKSPALEKNIIPKTIQNNHHHNFMKDHSESCGLQDNQKFTKTISFSENIYKTMHVDL